MSTSSGEGTRPARAGAAGPPDAASPAGRIAASLARAAADLGAPDAKVQLERPRGDGHGDLASNLAMVLASKLRRGPRQLAEALLAGAGAIDGVVRAEVAGPGFLNFFLEPGAASSGLDRILALGDGYGRNEEGAGRPVMVEFVSANPTGPLHLGHGRQAALGDAVARLLEWSGWRVHREFYFNDAGRQIDRLAESVRVRYQQLFGREESVPQDGYRGEYVVEIARAFRAEHGDRWLDDDSEAALEAMRAFAVARLRREHESALSDFGVRFDEYYRETSLYADGLVAKTVEALDDAGVTYRSDGACWLATTRFGDQKDRVMVKSDGSPTYFLPDVAYHMTKWDRGFRHAVNVQGADHHGTVDRVRAGLQALGRPAGYPEYVLHQMVTVERAGQEVRFSKRAGSYATLAGLVGEVGAAVARYFFLMRRPEAHLVFDLDLALDQSDKNPVYKVQYAHARLCRLLDLGGRLGCDLSGAGADFARLTASAEQDLAGQLSEFPSALRRAAENRAPQVLCAYLEQTAGLANSWYQSGHPSRAPGLQALVKDDSALRTARLALARAARVVLRNGLDVLGVPAPARMRRRDRPEAEPLPAARVVLRDDLDAPGAPARAQGRQRTGAADSHVAGAAAG